MTKRIEANTTWIAASEPDLLSPIALRREEAMVCQNTHTPKPAVPIAAGTWICRIAQMKYM